MNICSSLVFESRNLAFNTFLNTSHNVVYLSLSFRSLGREDPLEKGMVTHSSNLAWRISGTEEPEGLQSMGMQRIGHD